MKNSKNILIISPFFYPEPISTGKFNTDFAVGLKDLGHNVKILCYHPLYPTWKINKTKAKINNIEIIRGGKFLWFSKKPFLRRFILELSYAFFILRKIKTSQKNIDIIIPVFPPSLAFFSIIPLLKKNIQKVGMVHDLQEFYSEEKKGLVFKVLQAIIHKTEKKCYNSCNKLIFLSNEMRNESEKIYGLKNTKLEVQYPFITIKNQFTNDLEHIFDDAKRHIVYSGALGEKQNPEGLYDFFDKATLSIDNSIFHFFSEGEEFNKLKQKNNNPKILFHNLVKKENLEELYLKSDVQIIPQKTGTSKGSLPSKLPNLLASECKVFLITDSNSELEKLFKEYSLSFVSTNWENETLIKNLKKLLNEKIDFEHQNKVARNIFTIDKMIEKILY
ncbi:glycosyltransferase [Polaribacter sp.]|uniref:glycosyltransferase n=1 Tax=Polaribacter sp. TaxID=1920175 RepID=UPI003F6C7C66